MSRFNSLSETRYDAQQMDPDRDVEPDGLDCFAPDPKLECNCHESIALRATVAELDRVCAELANQCARLQAALEDHAIVP